MSENKMNPKVKVEWLGALRSGEYKQGKEYLRTQEEKFCCLGVLCDLSEGLGKWEVSATVGPEIYAFETLIAHLPRSVSDWAEIPETIRDNVDYSIDSLDKLIGMNDNGKSFPQIADWIEENL